MVSLLGDDCGDILWLGGRSDSVWKDDDGDFLQRGSSTDTLLDNGSRSFRPVAM